MPGHEVGANTVLLYKFTETVSNKIDATITDLAGNYNLSIINEPEEQGMVRGPNDGVYGRSFWDDTGSGAYVRNPSEGDASLLSALQSGDVTFEAFIRPYRTDTDQSIMVIAGPGTTGSDDRDQFNVYVSNPGHLQYRSQNASGTLDVQTSSQVFSANQDYHIAVVRKDRGGGNVDILMYVDGVKVDEWLNVNGMPDGGSRARLNFCSNSGTSGTNQYYGVIKDARIITRALDDAEIASDAALKSTTAEHEYEDGNTLFHYRFDATPRLIDLSSNKLHATLQPSVVDPLDGGGSIDLVGTGGASFPLQGKTIFKVPAGELSRTNFYTHFNQHNEPSEFTIELFVLPTDVPSDETMFKLEGPGGGNGDNVLWQVIAKPNRGFEFFWERSFSDHNYITGTGLWTDDESASVMHLAFRWKEDASNPGDIKIATFINGTLQDESGTIEDDAAYGYNGRIFLGFSSYFRIQEFHISNAPLDQPTIQSHAESTGAEGGGNACISLTEHVLSKSQFSEDEDLVIVFPPFVNSTDGTRIVGTDTASLVIKKPDGTLVSPAIAPAFDGDVDQWKATVPKAQYQKGLWQIKATSDDGDAIDQYLALVWGDYMSDIGQASLGRWKVENGVLTVYGPDGSTPLKQFDLLDDEGNPTSTRIFERNPQ